jgi:hypothetical protein
VIKAAPAQTSEACTVNVGCNVNAIAAVNAVSLVNVVHVAVLFTRVRVFGFEITDVAGLPSVDNRWNPSPFNGAVL